MSNTWDGAGTVWDGAEWQAGKPPVPDFSKDWLWQWQPATGARVNLNGLLVEARWTTESHTQGDGTFRGDIQPGKITARLWDPAHLLDNLDKFGAMFALYKPTGAAWCWFYDSFARGLYAPADPLDADCVYTGLTWPGRYTNNLTLAVGSLRPVESVTARLGAAVAQMNQSGYYPPAVVAGSFAAQSQTLPAQTQQTGDEYPGILTMVRDAASDGVAWLSATPPTVDQGPFGLTLNYARWETINARVLDASQVIAGPPVTASAAWVITAVSWSATRGDGYTSTWYEQSGSVLAWGYQGPEGVRVVGDITSTIIGGTYNGPEWSATHNTTIAMLNAYSDPTLRVLDSVDVQAGVHRTPTGVLSPTEWDPYAHTFGPLDVLTLNNVAGQAGLRYRVTSTDHRLTATVWQSTHHLEAYAAATPLP
jgi:hypothetical protein